MYMANGVNGGSGAVAAQHAGLGQRCGGGGVTVAPGPRGNDCPGQATKIEDCNNQQCAGG